MALKAGQEVSTLTSLKISLGDQLFSARLHSFERLISASARRSLSFLTQENLALEKRTVSRLTFTTQRNQLSHGRGLVGGFCERSGGIAGRGGGDLRRSGGVGDDLGGGRGP